MLSLDKMCVHKREELRVGEGERSADGGLGGCEQREVCAHNVSVL